MTDSPVPHQMHPDIALDQELALKTAAARLDSEFGQTLGVETIERFLRSSYDQFSSRATVSKFLPLLAERFTRQHLYALAKIEGKTGDNTPTVLFLCTHNAGRSQMALGYFTHYARDNAVAWSGGSEPGNGINAAAIEAMAEVGIDITGEYPKPWTDEIVQAADVVVTMGCGDTCPIFPGKRYENWELPDPAGQASTPCARSETRSINASANCSPSWTCPSTPIMADTSVLFVCVGNAGNTEIAAAMPQGGPTAFTVRVLSGGPQRGMLPRRTARRCLYSDSSMSPRANRAARSCSGDSVYNGD